MNTTFKADRVNQRIDDFSKMLTPEIQRHQAKWRQSAYNWHQKVRVLRQFATFRPAYLKAHLINKFDLKGTVRITLNISPTDAGQIKLSSLTLAQFPWRGNYFKEVPIQIEAVPNDSFRFRGWSNSIGSDSASITVTPSQDISITAYFEKSASTRVDQQTNLPLEFSLEQNYPNPFNHSTSIRYGLPEDCSVTIVIFDMLGRKVAILQNDNQAAGRHQVDWGGQADGNSAIKNLSSGVYFYRIEAVSKTRAYTDVKKMIYLK